MKRSILFSSVLISLLSSFTYAQNEAKKWYFGGNAGLDFMTSPPTILTNGAMYTSEGCASAADGAGNLLLYTDGVTVWNQNHQVMANGSGLSGNLSTSQSALVIRQPGSQSQYYVFTLGAGGNSNLDYSIVDMSLAAGIGSVTVKNTTISLNNSEKLTAARHCNGQDFWIVSHDIADNFRAYLLTAAGVNTVPVISTIGSSAYATYCMKISANGKRLGATLVSWMASCEVFDFDNGTGILTNSLSLPFSGGTYGCEFSPDGSLFYASSLNPNSRIIQWNLCAGSNSAIVASEYTVTSPSSAVKAALQLGPDGKIYASRWSQASLGVISNPNVPGVGCNYNETGQSVGPGICQYGLPNFMTSLLKPAPAPFTYTVACQKVSFTGMGTTNTLITNCSAASYSLLSPLWNFGEPGAGAANTSSLNNPVHTYSTAGTYTVQMIRYYNCANDTLRKVVTVTTLDPTLTVAGTFSICPGQKATLTASGASTYSWSNGAASPVFTASPAATTIYTVTGTNTTNLCSGAKTVTVTLISCVGISEAASGTGNVRLYPNPSSGLVFLECGTAVNVIISDALSRIVYEASFEAGKQELNIKALSNGIYQLKALAPNGGQTFRLIKVE